MKSIFLPALRGNFGDWIYYSALVPLYIIKHSVKFITDIHNDNGIWSNKLQRDINENRQDQILNYLRNDESRFLNSIVLAVYEGEPKWIPANFDSKEQNEISEFLQTDDAESIGLLNLSGEEKLFAIDGQHRVAGIKELDDLSENIKTDRISVLFVSHTNDSKGIIRTRKLFTDLNKKAVPVGIGDRIALDENDMMALVTRRLVEQGKVFDTSTIKLINTTNLNKKDLSIYSIRTLYNVLLFLFKNKEIQKEFILCNTNYQILTSQKLNDGPIDEKYINLFYHFAEKFFKDITTMIPAIKEYFNCKKDSDRMRIIQKFRYDNANILYFDIGIKNFIKLIPLLSGTLENRIKILREIPQSLSQKPYVDIIYDEQKGKFLNIGKKETLSFLIIKYAAKVITEKEEEKLKDELKRLYDKELASLFDYY